VRRPLRRPITSSFRFCPSPFMIFFHQVSCQRPWRRHRVALQPLLTPACILNEDMHAAGPLGLEISFLAFPPSLSAGSRRIRLVKDVEAMSIFPDAAFEASPRLHWMRPSPPSVRPSPMFASFYLNYAETHHRPARLPCRIGPRDAPELLFLFFWRASEQSLRDRGLIVYCRT